MKKVFISQLMKDLTKEEIQPLRDAGIAHLALALGDIEIIDSYFGDDYDPHKEMKGIESVPLFYLGKSFQLLATADHVLFIGNPEEGRGTKLEYEAAQAYGIEWSTVTVDELRKRFPEIC